MELKPLFRIVEPEYLGEAGRGLFEINLTDAILGTLQQPDLTLAEGQDVEPPIAAEEGQKGLDVETVGDDY